MKIWTRILRLNIGQLYNLSVLFLKAPLLLLPTLKATKRTFAICNELYGKTHNKSNKANAFRHAIWNVLICKKTFKNTRNKQKSVFWAQKFTDAYEKVTQNNVLDEAMDLHNNAVGRICFLNLISEEESDIVFFLQGKIDAIHKVTSVNEMQNCKNELVYLVA